MKVDPALELPQSVLNTAHSVAKRRLKQVKGPERHAIQQFMDVLVERQLRSRYQEYFPYFKSIAEHDYVIVEGSEHAGKLQPDYIVRKDDPHLQPLFRDAEKLRQNPAQTDGEFWKQIQQVESLVQEHLPRSDYENKDYLRFLSESRQRQVGATLGDYVSGKFGVCREHAQMLHLVLARAGIKSWYFYPKMEFSQRGNLVERIDHAVVVIPHRGSLWVIDSYNPSLSAQNRIRFESLMNGTPQFLNGATAKIVRLNSYPAITPIQSGDRIELPQ